MLGYDFVSVCRCEMGGVGGCEGMCEGEGGECGEERGGVP